MDKVEKVLVFAVVVGVALTVFIWIVIALGVTTCSTESSYYDMYNLKAPFGVFWTEGEVSGSGGGFIFYSFSFEGELEMVENYVVKYFDGEELKTKILNAENTSVVDDGTFRLEKITKVEKTTYPLIWSDDLHSTLIGYKIHIPYLPEVNATLTESWEDANR